MKEKREERGVGTPLGCGHPYSKIYKIVALFFFF
jgi:hypothetical protein